MEYRLVKLPGMPLVGLESRYVLQRKVTDLQMETWTTVPIVLAEQLTEAERSEMLKVLRRR